MSSQADAWRMGISLRIFICDKAEIIKIPQARYVRFREGEAVEFPEYAGQILDMAELLVVMRDRLPVSVAHEAYFRLRVDRDGTLDRDFEQHSFALAGTRIFPPSPHCRGSVIEAGGVFRQRALEGKVLWSPSPELKRRLVDMVFGRI